MTFSHEQLSLNFMYLVLVANNFLAGKNELKVKKI
jgi:hypothetical protein